MTTDNAAECFGFYPFNGPIPEKYSVPEKDPLSLPKLKCPKCLILEPHKEHTWTPSLEAGNIGGSLAVCSGFVRKRRFKR